MIDRMIVAVLLGLLGFAHGLYCPKQKTSPGREVVCYTSVSDIEQLTNAVCRCTTLVHQGYDVRNLSTSDFASFRKSLKEIKPPLQFMISIDDPAMTLNTSGTVRRETTARLLGILKDVDGVELNMTAGTKDRLVDFVKDLKDGLAKKSLDRRVFLVLPTEPENLAKQFDLKGLSKYVDLFTIRTHYLAEEDDDYHSFHPSRLMGIFDMFNADSLIDLITGLGAPKRKILVSVPANAYKFTLKNQDSNAPGSETEERQPTIIDRKQLCDSMNNGEWTVERDEDLTAPYAFKNKTWIALEDKISISIKGKYALLRELPGLAIHNIENDFETDCGKPLTHEIHHSFTDFKRRSRAAVLNALEDDLHQTQLTYSTKVKSSEFRVTRVVDTEGHIRAVRENTQTEFTCSRQGYFVHPKSCNRFYRCVKFNQEVEDYSVFEFDCPAGLAFDERTEVCVWPGSLPQGSPCPGSSEIAPVARVRFECPSTPGYYADPQNPRWFFACMDLGGPEMMAYEFRCPFGLIFDEHKLVCEWPWLVPGYSDGAYASTVYDNRGSTQAGGGYYTGGLGSQGGVYTGTTAGVGYSGSAGVGGHSGQAGHSGFSGAAGVGYSGTTTSGGYSGQSGFSGAGGYTGSNVGGHGSSFGQGATGYTGTTGSGYAGSKDSHVGTGGYTGTATGGYSGSGTVGADGSYGGSSGTGYTGYSGSTNEHTGSDLEYTGAIGTGQVSVGPGYAGTGSTVHSGTGGIYSGSAGDVHGGYTGTTGGVHGGYSGSTGGVHGGVSGSTGGIQGGYSGSTGGVQGGYSGSTGGVHGGYTGTTGGVHGGYSGSTDGVHGGVSSSTGGVQGGYSGSTGGVHGGYTGTTGGVHGGYSGSTGGVHGGVSGSTGGVHGGYSGSTGGVQGEYSGSTGGVHGGYTGTTGGVHGGYSGSTDEVQGGYSGSTGGVHGGYSGTTGGVHGGYSGTTGGVHGGVSSSTGGVHGGSVETGYIGTTAGGYDGSIGGGYAGSTTNVHGGSSTGGYEGSVGLGTGGVASGGSKGTVHGGSGAGGYEGSIGGQTGGYAGSTSGAHAGTIGGGYAGSTTNVHGGSSTGGYEGSVGLGTGGVTSGGYGGSKGTVHGGSGAGGYEGSIGGQTGGYAGSTSGAHAGTIGGGYEGSSGAHAGTIGGGYAGSTTNVHGGSSTGGYEGSVGLGTGGVTSGGYGGSKGTVHGGSGAGGYEGSIGGQTGGYAGSTSSAHAGTIGGGYEGSSGAYAGTVGGGYQGSTIGGHVGVGYVGTTAGGYEGGVQTGGIGTGYSTGGYTPSGIKGGQTGSSNVQFSVPGTQYTGSNLGGSQTGTGQTIIYGTRPQTGVYDSSGTIGAGVEYTGGVQGHTSGTTYVQKPGTPPVNCVTNCVSTVTLPGQIYPGHGGSADVFPGQKGVTTTYFGSTGSQGYDQSVIGAGKTTYQGGSGYTGGYYGSGGTGGLNVTFGSQVPSIGTTYHGFGKPSVSYGVTGSPGTIITGNGIPGSIITGDSSPGTVITYGETPGTVISGSVDQGTIVTGGVQPGYVKTSTGAPGYVVSGGVKTVYTGSASPGTAVYGTPAPGTIVEGQPSPGIVLTGHAAPGIVLTGQTAPGVSLHGPVDQGTVVGSTGVHSFADSGYSQGGVTVTPAYGTKFGVSTTPATGYKINEYHDNGGRGTIKFNNGDVTTKYTENDIPDYRPAGGSIPPDTLISGYPTGGSGQPVSTGFTKTGPTKTGITTATLGGRGTYVISTGQTRPTLKPDAIGEKAFDGNVAGFTKSSTEGSIYQSTQSQDVNYVDTSKITLEPKTGYTYPKPSIPFETGVRKPVVSSTEGGILTATTPTPYLNVEVYNSPKLFGSTVSPGLDNTYTGSTEGYYQGKVPSGFTHGPVPTSTPIIYTTGSLDGYKTTLFDAAKIPVVSTTVRPVIDTGYQTVVSSTPIPGAVTRNQFEGGIQTGSVSSQTQFDYGRRTFQEGGYGQNGYVSSTTQPSVFGVTSTYTISKPRPFAPAVTVTEQPEVNYVSSTPSGLKYFDTKSSFGQRVTSSGFADSQRPQTQYLPSDSGIGVTYGKPFPDVTYQHSTPTPQTGGSPTNVEISRNEVDKLVTNYNRGTTKYVPSQYDVYTPGVFGGDASRTQTSSFPSSGVSYGSTPAPFGKTQSSFSGGYTRPTSVVSYQTTAKSTAVGKAKVIVKWSDLHPLLLGKLGAECTCKGDPFSNLRGPGSRLIDSSNGKVDLANYDDSEIYVDLDKDGSYEDGDDYTTYQGPTKIWPLETPVPALNSISSRIQEPPSSTYLPSVTASIHAGLRGSIPPSPSTNQEFRANFRSGKSLSNAASTTNSVGKGASFDRYGPGGLRDSEEVLEGATHCARPGLFRHPNFCNKFYACHWDDWKKKFTLHVFNCPVHLTFDNGAGACNWPSMGPACQDDNLLV
ncbi:uncharacterized protein LOC143215245 [Lasioglossum baleicum]|uniref:uncharacterized protein LOC143215245 n=1 Tax=Lasioglossum baleicum TaxID=434251 RepID=UPI003FCC3252